MALDLLLAAGPAIHIHLASTLTAFGLGLYILLARPKGSRLHRRLGWAFVVLMLTAAFSSLWITDTNPGHYSAIHVLSIVTPVSLAIGVISARRHNVNLHRRFMVGIFLGALVIAGIFTLLPQRLLGKMLLASLS